MEEISAQFRKGHKRERKQHGDFLLSVQSVKLLAADLPS